jgi:hypothetical protein
METIQTRHSPSLIDSAVAIYTCVKVGGNPSPWSKKVRLCRFKPFGFPSRRRPSHEGGHYGRGQRLGHYFGFRNRSGDKMSLTGAKILLRFLQLFPGFEPRG